MSDHRLQELRRRWLSGDQDVLEELVDRRDRISPPRLYLVVEGHALFPNRTQLLSDEFSSCMSACSFARPLYEELLLTRDSLEWGPIDCQGCDDVRVNLEQVMRGYTTALARERMLVRKFESVTTHDLSRLALLARAGSLWGFDVVIATVLGIENPDPRLEEIWVLRREFRDQFVECRPPHDAEAIDRLLDL